MMEKQCENVTYMLVHQQIPHNLLAMRALQPHGLGKVEIVLQRRALVLRHGNQIQPRLTVSY
jgi:hypothetical protein